MNCNCIKETEAAIRQQLEGPAGAVFRPKKAERLAQVEIKGASFAMTGLDLNYTFTLPVTLTWALPSGMSQKKQTSIAISYCPFCGKSTKEEDITAAA